VKFLVPYAFFVLRCRGENKANENILVIDDDPGILESLEKILKYEGYGVCLADNGKEGIDLYRRESPDLVLLDIKMPGMDGIEVLQEIRTIDSNAYLIIISGHGTIQSAVEATKFGAYYFLEKPLDQEQLFVVVRNALRARSLFLENIEYKANEERRYRIVGESESLKEVIQLAEKVAQSNARVLIRGDNGTGKELLARYIHRKSKRNDKIFIEVNCAAIPRELVESELFGHEKGSFTGAYSKKIGKFQQAHNGTLFLDEIGDMSLDTQAKVLRALQDGIIQRVGGHEDIQVDVRVISATNKDLEREIEQETFREDLYYRLNVVTLWIPSLRERKEDIPLLVENFLRDFSVENGVKTISITNEALEYFKGLPWPGNIRELKNTVERLAILSGSDEIGLKEVKEFAEGTRRKGDTASSSDFDTYSDFKETTEKAFLKAKLEENGWNVSETARKLGMQRSNLYKKIEKYDLSKGDH
jgi:two-component system nitrogen regulation response regulator NtrX